MAATPRPRWLLSAIAAETLVGYQQPRALIEALDPCDQFESSAAHSTAIVAFKLALRLSPHDASRHGHNNVVKYIIVPAVLMATTYQPYA